jgi:hypothetical protein
MSLFFQEQMFEFYAHVPPPSWLVSAVTSRFLPL